MPTPSVYTPQYSAKYLAFLAREHAGTVPASSSPGVKVEMDEEEVRATKRRRTEKEQVEEGSVLSTGTSLPPEHESIAQGGRAHVGVSTATDVVRRHLNDDEGSSEAEASPDVVITGAVGADSVGEDSETNLVRALDRKSSVVVSLAPNTDERTDTPLGLTGVLQAQIAHVH
jgi:hypothetical protein